MATSEERPLVHIHNGGLQGVYLESRNGRFYAAFKGIPYADKPERFELAKPVSNWKGVRDASNFSPECMQWDDRTNSVIGTEDSLTVNVFVPYDAFCASVERDKSIVKKVTSAVAEIPKIFRQKVHLQETQQAVPSDTELPVLVFIHGGKFQFGCSNQHGPEYLMDEDIILVTLNYRLGVLGFLATGDDVIPGNIGLKDQVLALKWIQQNIRHFGGNSRDVTLYGESAGGAAVSLQVISPLSRGLFHKAISSSGSAFNEWVFQEDPKRIAIELVKQMNGAAISSEEIKEFLKACPTEDICRISQADKNPLHNPLYVAIIEHKDVVDPFITDSPRALYSVGNFATIPLLITANADEGLSFKSALIYNKPEFMTEINDHWFDAAPHLYHYEHLEPIEKLRISEDFLRFYFDNKIPPLTDGTFQNFTDSFSDILFLFGVRELGIMHAVHSPVYAGILDIKGSWSGVQDLGYPPNIGMAHADDLQYIFNFAVGQGYPKIHHGSEMHVVSQRLVRMIANFVKFGNPNIDQFRKDWHPIADLDIRSRDLAWMYIRNREAAPDRTILAKRMKFADQFYQAVGMV